MIYTSIILGKIQKEVGEILESDIEVKLSHETISRLRRNGYNSPTRYTANLNSHITFILKELWENALDACTKKGLSRQQEKIQLRVNYNSIKGAITLRMRDNGVGNKSELTNKKDSQENLDVNGGINVFELYLKDFDFVTEHRKVFSDNGAVVQVKISLPHNQ